MSNATLDLISRHGSVRKYRPDLVPVETIETIISAAQRTSTSSNMQAYSVVAVMDAAKRARLAELCGNQEHIAQAPVFLAWCADLARLDRACELRGYLQVDWLRRELPDRRRGYASSPRRRPRWPPNRWGWASATSAASATTPRQ